MFIKLIVKIKTNQMQNKTFSVWEFIKLIVKIKTKKL